MILIGTWLFSNFLPLWRRNSLESPCSCWWFELRFIRRVGCECDNEKGRGAIDKDCNFIGGEVGCEGGGGGTIDEDCGVINGECDDDGDDDDDDRGGGGGGEVIGCECGGEGGGGGGGGATDKDCEVISGGEGGSSIFCCWCDENLNDSILLNSITCIESLLDGSWCWRWEKHKKVGWIVFTFSSFSTTEVTDQN